MTTTFADLGVPAPLVDSLARDGITAPFPIQAATMADALAGRDVLGRGRTGSGKTVAFAVPTVAALAKSRRPRTPGRPRALMLVPTRELAVQVMATVAPLATAMGLRTMTIFGGVGRARRSPPSSAGGRRRRHAGSPRGPHRPGPLPARRGRGHRPRRGRPPLRPRLPPPPSSGSSPPPRRTASAALLGHPRPGGRPGRQALPAPAVTHSVDSADSPVPAMTHHLLQVTSDGKSGVVQRLVGGQGRTVAFTRTKHRAKKLAKELTAAGIPGRRPARQPVPGRAPAQPRRLRLGGDSRPRRHRHRRPRHPRGRRRARRPRRPADRAQGLPAPFRPYGARGCRGRRRHRQHPRRAPRGHADDAQGRHQAAPRRRHRRAPRPRGARRPRRRVRQAGSGRSGGLRRPVAGGGGGGGGRVRTARGGARGGQSAQAPSGAGRGRRGGARSGSAAVYSTSTGSHSEAPRGGGQARPGQRSGAAPAGSTGGAAAFSSSRSPPLALTPRGRRPRDSIDL